MVKINEKFFFNFFHGITCRNYEISSKKLPKVIFMDYRLKKHENWYKNMKYVNSHVLELNSSAYFCSYLLSHSTMLILNVAHICSYFSLLTYVHTKCRSLLLIHVAAHKCLYLLSHTYAHTYGRYFFITVCIWFSQLAFAYSTGYLFLLYSSCRSRMFL